MVIKSKYINKKIGKLLVIKILTNGNFECLCDCGNICIKTPGAIYTGINRENTSCGCSMYQYKEGNESYLWKGCGDISAKFWKRCETNAKYRNLLFDIKIDDVWEIFLDQDKRCAISGVELCFGKSSFVWGTASLDRISSEIGYIIDNIWWIHKEINDMKWDLSLENFLQYCYYICNPIKDLVSCDIDVNKRGKSWGGIGNLSGDLWDRIKRNARKRNIELVISMNQAWDKFIEQNGCCKYTGIPLLIDDRSEITASLDRKNNILGYTLDNIQWVHKHINHKIKKYFSEDKVRNWCKQIVEYYGVNYESEKDKENFLKSYFITNSARNWRHKC